MLSLFIVKLKSLRGYFPLFLCLVLSSHLFIFRLFADAPTYEQVTALLKENSPQPQYSIEFLDLFIGMADMPIQANTQSLLEGAVTEGEVNSTSISVVNPLEGNAITLSADAVLPQLPSLVVGINGVNQAFIDNLRKQEEVSKQMGIQAFFYLRFDDWNEAPIDFKSIERVYRGIKNATQVDTVFAPSNLENVLNRWMTMQAQSYLADLNELFNQCEVRNPRCLVNTYQEAEKKNIIPQALVTHRKREMIHLLHDYRNQFGEAVMDMILENATDEDYESVELLIDSKASDVHLDSPGVLEKVYPWLVAQATSLEAVFSILDKVLDNSAFTHYQVPLQKGQEGVNELIAALKSVQTNAFVRPVRMRSPQDPFEEADLFLIVLKAALNQAKRFNVPCEDVFDGFVEHMINTPYFINFKIATFSLLLGRLEDKEVEPKVLEKGVRRILESETLRTYPWHEDCENDFEQLLLIYISKRYGWTEPTQSTGQSLMDIHDDPNADPLEKKAAQLALQSLPSQIVVQIAEKRANDTSLGGTRFSSCVVELFRLADEYLPKDD